EGPEASAAEADPGAADADAASHEPVLVVREAVEEQAAAEAAEHAAHDADAHAHHDAVDHDHDTHGETADAHQQFVQQFVPAEAHVADEAHDDQHGPAAEGQDGDSQTGDSQTGDGQSGDGQNGDENGEEEEVVESVGGDDALEEATERLPRLRRQYKIQEVIKR